MALFKSQVLTQASGSVGGMTYTRGRSGMVIRAKSMPVNTNTQFQQAVRANQSILAQAWQTTLTDLQRDGWNNYAAEIARKNKLGDTIFLTGQQMFVRCNSPRLQASLPMVAAGPTEFTLGDPVTNLQGVTEEVGAANGILLTWDPGAIPATANLLVYISRPMSPTREFFKGPFRYNGEEAADLGEYNVQNARLPEPVGVGNKVVIRARVTYADGRLSDAVFTSLIASLPIPG